MPANHLSFRPPSLALDAELEWLLRRAFGPLDWTAPNSVPGQNVVERAIRLDIAARIASRNPRKLLEEELAPEAAERLREQYLGTVARDALLRRALLALLQEAEALGVPCILLKYAALSQLGVLRPGARTACDIDILVPRRVARQFRVVLMQSGYEDVGLPESAHQLAGLQDCNGVLIEIHVHVPGVTLGASKRFAEAEDLISAGLARPVGSALLPSPAFVAAHALVHGLAQHARAPHMYSALKTFADLADLEQAGYGAFEDSAAFLTESMTTADITCAIALARALRSGDLETASSNDAGILLSHALASRLNGRYAARLRLRLFTQPGPTPIHFSKDRALAVAREAWGWARSFATGLRGRA